MPILGERPEGGRFIVGVDFGTTFTSVAFAHSSSPGDVKLVNTWPNGTNAGESAYQVPSELHYTTLGTDRTYLWGHTVSAPGNTITQPLRWFKILLQADSQSLDSLCSPRRRFSSSSSSSSRVSTSVKIDFLIRGMKELTTATPSGERIELPMPGNDTAMSLKQLGVEPRTVVADFLQEVRKVAVESIGKTYSVSFVEQSKIFYVVTVPAIWSDVAKDLMVRACTEAGFGVYGHTFQLVSEPEAAAAYTLKVVQPHNLKTEDVFIICDAGGGTVDLISYKIRGLKPQLEMDEVVSGSGDLCGSVYLDELFAEYIQDKLGPARMEKMSTRGRQKMERSWVEDVKLRFGENVEGIYDVAVPGIEDNGMLEIYENYHTMSYKTVQSIFDPIVHRVIKLVDQQVRAVEAKGLRVSAILLVGGFGSSSYLHKCLQKAEYGKKKHTISIMQPVNAKTAIARGALLRGLTGSAVITKRSRLFYGLSAASPLAKYPEGRSHAYHDAVCGEMRVPGHLTWYVKKEDELSADISHSFSFFRHVPCKSKDFVFVDLVYATSANSAPRFEWEEGADVLPVGTLRSDLRKARKSTMPKIVASNGKKYYRVDYIIKMTMEGETMRFELMYNQKSYGTVGLEFERMN